MKTKAALPKTIDEYIAGHPTEVQERLQKIRSIVRAVVPEAQEAIKYRIPTFVLKENLLHFAAFSRHIGFYPTSSGIRQFKDQLTSYHTSKGAIQFPLERPIPYGLVKKMAQFRAKEARARRAGKKRSR